MFWNWFFRLLAWRRLLCSVTRDLKLGNVDDRENIKCNLARSCNNCFIIPSHYVCKMCTNFFGILLAWPLWRWKENLKICDFQALRRRPYNFTGCFKSSAVQPRFNEVAGDRPNLFVKSRVRYIENLDITNLSGNDQNVRHIEVIVLRIAWQKSPV